MADEVKSRPTPEGISFQSANCREISYLISVTREKFDLDKFHGSFPNWKNKEIGYGTLCAPRDPATGDYHVHADWDVDPKEINFKIDYERGPKNHEPDEHEPYAEQFMEWLGQFFKHENAHTHLHAEFEYQLEMRESKFLLPLKTNLGPHGNEAEINGISLTLPSQPEGVMNLWVTRAKTKWRVQAAANRRITFKGFTPYEDMRAIISVVEMVIEEKKS